MNRLVIVEDEIKFGPNNFKVTIPGFPKFKEIVAGDRDIALVSAVEFLQKTNPGFTVILEYCGCNQLLTGDNVFNFNFRFEK